MKIKRQKKVQRVLNFFKHNFGHRPPFQILMDGTFAQACLAMKVNIREQIPKYLGEVKLLTTQCCIMELEKLGPQLFGAASILKQFPIHKCGHDKEAKPAAKCLKAMLEEKNPKRYFVATQDATLRQKARRVPGTPILYLHHSAPTLEKPSYMSSDTADQIVSDRMGKSYQSQKLEDLKRKEFGEPEADRRRKRKGPSGPNPLSVLSSKKKKLKLAKEEKPTESKKTEETETEEKAATSEGDPTKRKRFRKRKRGGTAEEEATTAE